ncbi:MAG: hypothetical protein P8P48_07990 [Saprospiraceae bacterium]|nr:hypothetical protein [Saprospiraceae bacterium]
MKPVNWKKYAFEFLSIFIAILAAFALDNWNDNRNDRVAEAKILTEILNGLEKDKEDVAMNILGHELGLKACTYWRNITKNQLYESDSLRQYYIVLTRDFISIQNTTGYETLKSRGLELVENDSLRERIVTLYEFDYQVLRKLEEEYGEMQFHENYFEVMNTVLLPYMQFDSIGSLSSIEYPLDLERNEENLLLSHLWKIEYNRNFVLREYQNVEKKILALKADLNVVLKR